MTADEEANLVLAFAKVLYINGRATEQTVSAAERPARAGDCTPRLCRAGASCSSWPTTGTALIGGRGRFFEVSSAAQQNRWHLMHPPDGTLRHNL
jgi:hypothetical protein